MPSRFSIVRLFTAWLAGLGAVCGIALGVYHGVAALKHSERLRVREVRLNGNQHVTPGELEAYSGVRVGDPILDLELDAVAAQLLRHPFIAAATVRRSLPGEVRIDIREHKPAMLVSIGEVYLASADGILFKRLAAGDEANLPVLTGVRRDDVDKRPDEVARWVREALSLKAALAERPALGRVDELHWDEDLGFSAVLTPRDEGALPYRLHLGRTPMQRLDLATTAVARVKQLGVAAEALYVDGVKYPWRIHAKVRGNSSSKSGTTLIATAHER